VGSPQAFLSYRTRLRDEVAPLVEALTLAGVRVWRDEARVDEGSSITSEVIEGLSSSHALLAYYSPDYPRSRICQWEQAAAWVAAEAAGPAQERVLLLLPHNVAGPDHVLGLLRDELALRVPAPSAHEDLKHFAEQVALRLARVSDRSLGDLLPLAVPPEWKLRARVAPSERFTGRAKDLWNLHALLHRDRLTVITGRTGPSTAQVRGLGGIGKTLLAVEYVARFGAGFPGGIFWIDTANRTPESARVDAAIALGVPADKPEQLRAALLGCGSYLWVADNLPSGLSQAEVEAWCAPTSNGRTLVTTRSKTWGAMGGTLDLDVLAPDEALELLTRRRPTTTEVAAAEELCRRVGYHPLTVDVLGALIGLHSSETPYAAWRAQLDHPSADALRLGERLAEELPTGSARYVGTVLRASLEGLAPEALDLLLLSVSLAEAPIPAALAVAVLTRLAAGDGAAAELRWTLGVDAGVSRSLLDRKQAEAPQYAVHPVVRRVLRYEGDAGRVEVLREAALAAVLEQFDGAGDIRNHRRIAPLVPHAKTLGRPLATQAEQRMEGVVAHFHHVRGDYPEARHLYERALEAMTRLLGEEHPDTLGSLQNLAGTLDAQGDLPGARRLFERALEARTRLLGEEHPDTLNTLQNLAATLKAQGDLPGARRLFERALEARTRLLGEEHPDTLSTLHNLAATLKAQGDLRGARRLEERALEARTRLLGEEHPDTLRTLQNLAATLKAQGDLPGARRLYRRALEAMTRLLGEEHPVTLTTLQNLAGTLKAQGDLPGARRLDERALEARGRLLGEEHPDTLNTLHNLAGTLYAQGDLPGARRLYQRALEARGRLLGEEHPDTLTTLQNLAVTLKAEADLPGARRLEERALEARTRLLGEEHPDTLATLQNLAVTLYDQGDLPGARRLEERAFEARARLLGEEHPDTLSTLQNLAGTLNAQGDLPGARSLYERALEARTRLLGEEHPDTTMTRFNLVLTLRRVDPAAAAPHLIVLRRLSHRPAEGLSAVEKQILAALQTLE
jgi:tetratricopeptide (TPR) repeat protein